MLDKILIGLMILILPVTVGLSWYYLGQDSVDEEEMARMQKLDGLIAQLSKKASEPSVDSIDESLDISINTVFYASESAELQVAGIAPRNNLHLFVATVENDLSNTQNSTDSAVLGESVSTKVVKVGAGGEFSFTYPTEGGEDLLLELRLEQGQAAKTVIYNFESASFEQY